MMTEQHDSNGTILLLLSPVRMGDTMGYPSYAKIDHQKKNKLIKPEIPNQVAPWVPPLPFPPGVAAI